MNHQNMRYTNEPPKLVNPFRVGEAKNVLLPLFHQ